uniref:Protein transporter SEC9 n=1 Tax=Mycena chlorophos TaxID=658473 RepID=A0ABQ0L4U6_MYCCL|nr:protein transporter SEC9 [Mycena chlorophos]
MPMFKRRADNNKSQIPPVQGTLVDPRDRYQRHNGVGDAYTRAGNRGIAQLEQDRTELMGNNIPGAGARTQSSGRFMDGPDIDEEDDEEAIKQKTRVLKQESVASTQRSLRLAREAVETGNATMGRLERQTEQLAKVEHHLDMTKNHMKQADDKTEELRKLNRSIFIPAVTIDRSAEHAARELKTQQRFEQRRTERQQSRKNSDSEQFSGTGTNSRFRTEGSRKKFQFDATASDDEMEDALDSNLDEILSMASQMKRLGTNMNAELDRQNGLLSQMEDSAGKLEGRIKLSTVQLDRAGR